MFNNTTIFKHFQSRDHKMTSLSIRSIWLHLRVLNCITRCCKSQIVWTRLVIYNLPLSLEVKQSVAMYLRTTGLDLVNIRAVASSIIGGLIFIYSGSAQLISFEINCFYGLRTRIFEYQLFQLSSLLRPWISILHFSLSECGHSVYNKQTNCYFY